MAPITKKKHIMEAFNSEVNQLLESSKLESMVVPCTVNSVSYSVIQSPIRSKAKDSSSYSCTSSSSSSVTSDVDGHLGYVNCTSYRDDDSSYQQSQRDQAQVFAYESCKNSSPASASSSPSMSLPLLSPQYARVNRVVLDKNSDEYRKRRERNNIAVKKSRTKSKIKNAETMKKVNELKHENESLRSKVTCLATELRLLKNVLAAHASSAHGAHLSEFDIKLLTSTETLSLASPSASPVPSPPISSSSPSAGAAGAAAVFGPSKHSHLHHVHSHHHPHHHMSTLAGTSVSPYDALRSSLVQSTSFRDSLIRESIIHRNRVDSLSSSSSTSSSSFSPIMSPSSPPVSNSMLESFYMSNAMHASSNNPANSDKNHLLFKQTRSSRMSPVTSLNSLNSRSSCNDSEDDF